MYLDALRVKIRDHGSIRNKAVHLALGITTEGTKELLGLWLCQTEGAKFWLQVLTELKNRGVQDILIASVDGLTGFPEAIATVFPETQIQRCIVHQIRNSLKFVSYKDRRQVARDLKPIYQAATASEAGLALEAFAQTRDDRYPMISRSWTEHWDELTAFMEYPPRDPQGHLLHQCRRVAQRQDATSNPSQRTFPDRAGRFEVSLPRGA